MPMYEYSLFEWQYIILKSDKLQMLKFKITACFPNSEKDLAPQCLKTKLQSQQQLSQILIKEQANRVWIPSHVQLMNTNPDQANTSRKLYVALVLNFLLNNFDHNSKLKKSCFDPKGYFYENWLAYMYEIMCPKHPTCTTPLKKKMPSGCSLCLHFGVGRGGLKFFP